ncbi:hypothetical protein H7J71_24430 [Mycolicibacterium peregrinum]|uniref:hypothetical protein n=1 Tax=Mycolicibacterium peregrinum TaxID=43304 RepID=UPI001054C295|nr:hypothetical protein [Mycolicibacterium peregrinum]MCV7205159.1 hypothetical protein [Mycolicibacterium peregrinum]
MEVSAADNGNLICANNLLGTAASDDVCVVAAALHAVDVLHVGVGLNWAVYRAEGKHEAGGVILGEPHDRRQQVVHAERAGDKVDVVEGEGDRRRASIPLGGGTHRMRVSQLLGHSTYTLTLNTYGDWIPAEQYADDLPEPPAPAKPAKLPDNVINLSARQAK